MVKKTGPRKKGAAKKSAGESNATGDLPAAEFRAAMHRTADLIADYLEGVEKFPVLPKQKPGDLLRALPKSPPPDPESMDRILEDYQRLIVPGVTHWNHPGFLAYFSISGSGPGIIGEALAAALNVNAMLWRTGPAPTELEERACDWLRQMIGLPDAFRGHINDTASSSTLLALAAARHRLEGAAIRKRGMAGRNDLPQLMIYASEQAHSSVDKAAIGLGFGLDNVRKIGTDRHYRMETKELDRIIANDRAAGRRPVAVVATAGTTSTTSVDPLGKIAEVCGRERLWLHVDAAYAGTAAICPEYRALMKGWENADSVVLNPHKWMFTPMDCSVLLLREPDQLREAFSLVPEYLRTSETGVNNLMDYGFQLGRRFRALKLWMVIRAFGVSGLQDRIRAHCALGKWFASRVEADPEFQLCAPVPFSTICFRTVSGGKPEKQELFNQRLLEEVNATGKVLLSHTKLRGRFVLRLAIGNIKTRREHIEEAWDLIRDSRKSLLRKS